MKSPTHAVPKKEYFRMKIVTLLQDRAKSISRAVIRFPVVIAFLVTIAVLTSLQIEVYTRNFVKEFLPLIVGIFLSGAVQIACEKMKKPLSVFLISQGAVLAVTAAAYFLRIFYLHDAGLVDGLRVILLSFALLTAALWLPSIRWKANFNDVFMSLFKACFTAWFFSAVIWGGISLILVAVNSLLFKLPMNLLAHISVWIWILLAPLLVLSLTPLFDGSEEEKLRAEKQSKCPPFLRILLSFVLIPLAALFTLVLLAYMAKTLVNGDSKALMEPFILSYSIVVILLYVLASEIDNKISSFYRFVFPKLMVGLAFYQLIVSSMKIPGEGVTYGRYFVLLFCIFSVVIGILMSIFPVKRNHILAFVLTAFAITAILPPVDFYSISAGSQVRILDQVLIKNDMIVNGVIVPNSSISEKDQGTITAAVQNLNDMDALDRVKELPSSFQMNDDFNTTFGFWAYFPQVIPVESKTDYYSLDTSKPILIGSYDAFFTMTASTGSTNTQIIEITAQDGSVYRCKLITGSKTMDLDVLDAAGNVRIMTSITDKIDSLIDTGNETGLAKQLPPDDLTYEVDENGISVRIIFQNAERSVYGTETTYYASMYVLVNLP